MHGNVMEWCLDWYSDSYFHDNMTDPKGPGSGIKRTIRGGCWNDAAEWCAASGRTFISPSTKDSRTGFRLASRSAEIRNASSAPWSLDTRVESETPEVKNGSMDIVWSGLWNGNASSKVTLKAVLNGGSTTTLVSQQTGSGVYTWHPSSYGTYTLRLENASGQALLTKTVYYREPSGVSDVKAQQRYPWNGYVDIDYTLSGDTSGLAVQIAVTDRKTGKVYYAQHFKTAPDATPGTHRATWDTGADGIVCVSDNLIATVSLVEPTYMVIDLDGGTGASLYPVSYLASEPSGGWNSDVYKTTKLVLRKIIPGTFTMGDQVHGGSVAQNITLTKPYYVGVFPVTQRQWELVMGDRPSVFMNNSYYATRPVENVSYNMIRGSSAGAGWPPSTDVDSGSFLAALRTKTGIDFDLPTEAQWEYAARSGTTTDYGNGTNYGNSTTDANMGAVGRYKGNSGTANYNSDTSVGTAKVGSYVANKWGLYDMHGNVWEWCLDWIGALKSGSIDPEGAATGSTDLRVVRGGSFLENAGTCTSAARSGTTPSSKSNVIGFRLSYTVPAAAASADSAQWSLDTRADDIDPLEIGDSIDIVWDSSWFGQNQTVKITYGSTVLLWQSGAGVFPWTLPADLYGDIILELLYNNGSGALTRTVRRSEKLAITSVSARQRYPWNNLVDIDYTVRGNASGLIPKLTVTDRASGRVYTPTNYAGTLSTATGSHRITWDTSADGLNLLSDKLVATLSFEEPDYMVIDISGGPNAISYPVSYLSDIPNGGWTDTCKSDKIVLRKIMPGTFKLRDQYSNTTISKPYFAGVFEVTQKQWELVMGSNPSTFYLSSVAGCQFRPVECVSYDMIRGASAGARWPSANTVDGASFMGVLREKTGLEALDLPTDAQWEYAARSGTSTDYGNGTDYVNEEQDSNMDVVGRYAYNSGYSDESYSFALATATAQVGSYATNNWGLCDMHGNVWEWCLDWMGNYANNQTDPKGPGSGSSRVVAGGSWAQSAYACTSYTRMGVPPDTEDQADIGFRLFCGTELAKVSADSDSWTLDSRAGGSEPLEVSGSMNIVWSSLWNGNASSEVTLKANGETFADNLSGEGVVSWSPSEYGVITLSMYTAGATAPLTRTINNPEPLNVSGVVAKQRYPWNGLVDIDYRVGGDPGNLTLKITVTDQKTGTTYTPSSFTVNPVKSTGTHRATWNAATDIASCISGDMVVTVSLSDSSGVQATFTSQPWSLDTRAGDSPMLVSDSIDIAYGVPWFNGATKVAIQIDGTNLVANLTGEGSVAWTPPYGLFTLKLVPNTGNPLTVTVKNPEPPSVSSVSAKQRYPWNGLVDIDYTVRGENDDRTLQITVADRAGGTTYTPTTFTLAPEKTAGTHHAVWNAKADVASCISGSMFVTVALVENGETVASSTSLAWSLDTRAGESPMLVADSIDVAYGTRWFAGATAVDLRIDGTNFVANLTGEGSVAWAPTSYGTFVFTLVPDVGNSLTVTIKNPEPPTIFSIAARQRYPWNGMVDIDYTVGGDTEGQAIAVSVTDRDTGTAYAPTNLLGEASVDVGTHRITWNTAADGISCVSTNMVVTLSLVSANDVFATGDSEPWSLDTRAGTETLEIEDRMNVAWSSLWYGDAASTVTVGTNGAVLVDNLVGEGAFEWVPPAPGDYEFTLVTEGTNETLTARIWVPGPASVTVDAAKQRFPWNGKVDIDYTVGGRLGDFDVQFSVTDRTSGTTYAPVTLEGTLSGERGTHRVTWDADAAGFSGLSTNMSVTATLVRAGSSDAVSSDVFTPWRLDTRDDIVITKGETLDIAYSDTAWGGSARTPASVSTNGAVLAGNLTGASSVAWTPAKLAVYALTHTPGDFTATVKVVETTGVLIDGVDIGEAFAGDHWTYDGDVLVARASGIVVGRAPWLSQDVFDAFIASKGKCEPSDLFVFEKQGDGSYIVVPAGIPYIDENGLERQCSKYIVVTADTATFEDGEWYVVPSDGEVSRGEITVHGSSHLILCDGATLTVKGAEGKAGIEVAANNGLSIYGQAQNLGRLNATGGNGGAGIGGSLAASAGDIVINGGTITAKAGTGAGIGSGERAASSCTITINGGIVKANGIKGAGIGAGYQSDSPCAVAIRGGKVSAIGSFGAGIGGSEGQNGGTATVTGGTVLALSDSGAGIGAGRGGTGHGSLAVGDEIVVKAGRNSVDAVELASGAGGAISLGGELYYHLAEPSKVTVVSARQRWPWNGIIDVTLDVAGLDPTEHYSLDLALVDVDGTVTNVHSYATDIGFSGIFATNGVHAVLDAKTADRAGILPVAKVSGNAIIRAELFNHVRASEIPSVVGKPDDATGATLGICGDVMVVDVSGGSSATNFPVTTHADVDIGAFNCNVYKTTKIVLRKVPAGTYPAYLDAATDYAPSGDINEIPTIEITNRLTSTKDYYIGIFETTRKQVAQVIPDRMALFGWGSALDGDDGMLAANNVNWTDILSRANHGEPLTEIDGSSFTETLLRKTGLFGFHLPTEGQWLIAYYAGSTAPLGSFWNGLSEENVTLNPSFEKLNSMIWNTGNSSDGPHVVGTKNPNMWGLYDMWGNVSEICRDDFAKSFRFDISPYVDEPYIIAPKTLSDKVLRGAAWSSDHGECFNVHRTVLPKTVDRKNYLGFRMACTMEEMGRDVRNAVAFGESLPMTIDTRADIVVGAMDGELRLDRIPPVWNENGETVSVTNATVGGAAVSWSDADHAWAPNPGGVYGFTKGNESATITVAVSLFPNAAPPTAVSGLVYDGKEQTLVQGGVLAVLSGGSETRTDAGDATLRYVPAPGYSWSDGSTAERSVAVSIAKKALTVIAEDKVCSMGREPPAFTYIVNGFVTGEGVAVLTTLPMLSCTYTKNDLITEVTREYDIVPSGAEAQNYAISYVNGTLTVQGRISVTFKAMGGTFDDGSDTKVQNCYFGRGYEFPSVTRPGYTLAGWYTSWQENAAIVMEGQALVDTAPHALYAKWTSTAPSTPSNGNLYLPDMVNGKANTTIVDKAYNGNTSITSVTTPAYLQTIGTRSFYQASNLKKLTITQPLNYSDQSPGTLTIKNGAFAGCGLEEVYIPDGVILEAGAFLNNSKLKKIVFTGDGQITCDPKAFQRCGYNNGQGGRIDVYMSEAFQAANPTLVSNLRAAGLTVNVITTDNAASVAAAKGIITGVSLQQTGTLVYDGSAQQPTVEKTATTVGGVTATFHYAADKDDAYSTTLPTYTAAGTYDLWYYVTAPNHDATTPAKTTIVVEAPAPQVVSLRITDIDVSALETDQTVVLTVAMDPLLPEKLGVEYATDLVAAKWTAIPVVGTEATTEGLVLVTVQVPTGDTLFFRVVAE